jgi:hypothetical protein
MVRLTPKYEAIEHANTFLSSKGVTAINKSAFASPVFFKSSKECAEPVMVIKSICELIFDNFSGESSSNTMSCDSSVNILAKCVPTSPAPAITIFIKKLSLKLAGKIKY